MRARAVSDGKRIYQDERRQRLCGEAGERLVAALAAAPTAHGRPSKVEAQLRHLLEKVSASDYPELPEVQAFLADHLRAALESLQQNMARANEFKRAS